MIETARVRLRPWRESDRAPLAAMHSDEEVMADYGGPLTRVESDAKFYRYAAAFETHGFSRFALERLDGVFLGYVGVMPIWLTHPVAPGVEVGWRLARSAWGAGYASEGARAALRDGFRRHGWDEVLSYTASDNIRSQAVMARLGLARDQGRDFIANDDTAAAWTGLVWVARPDMDWS
ncbi:GNAT family N-acetyltransferase [Phenylobacterium sp.]|jgi:RimJ/RimL family protein N-acetyltransferase|uniref:GNAT family N-acetyltransferase n=1 Tax=Phenylobacterium sp. TaxID=1871053 RepID=UPI0037CAA9D1